MSGSFVQTFERPATAKQFGSVYPDLDTRFAFGTQKNPGEKWPNGQTVTNEQAASSRMIPGTVNVQADGGFDPAQAYSPRALNGFLFLDAYKPRKPYSEGRTFYSALISPKRSFLYGRFTVRASLPIVAGTWPAVWLYGYSADKAEIDFMEHYGGPRTVMSQGKPFVVDRVLRPFSSAHLNERTWSNAPANMPTITRNYHDLGGVWHPEYISAEVDRREVWRIPNPGIHAPMRLIVDMDVSEMAGQIPAIAPGSPLASMIVQSIRVDPLL